MPEHRNGNIGARGLGRYGAAEPGIVLSDAPSTAAWNLHGDAENHQFVAEVRRLFDISRLPEANGAAIDGAWAALWLGPRSWLLFDGSRAQAMTLSDFHTKRDAINALGGALFDVSASRVACRIGGVHAETVLAKTCPLDFDARVFPVGRCAQSVLGRINALFFREDAAPTFLVLVARSLAKDAWRTLCESSAQYGYEVTTPRPMVDTG